MKTSNKLLTGFTGTLVLLMLFSAIILRVNYSKGITHNTTQTVINRDHHKETIHPFKVLLLTGVQTTTPGDIEEYENSTQIDISYRPEYSLQHQGGVTFRQYGDTLHITAQPSHDIQLTCPTLETIDCRQADLNIDGFTLPLLAVHMGQFSAAVFSNIKVNNFSFAGDQGSSLNIQQDSKADSIRIKLGKSSALTFSDIPYRYADIQVDSLRALHISGKALQHITVIK
ncbi:hypothetical protein [Chitinophaga nivalis]|uniref:Auto-transporter adhesin head GIN domain-containing protein n=1 Tax=Chitinophaga nivalis TaxID=2991709 RepID=A0ABT3ITN1_9BACT|nr:hypothetical protein [Chitinophaga nivalis]MCW3462956.1 hypothetical protein [Chitinophaga nivalis]MCW3487354.1 hypothetical protein [Chitinophaga nivalis]